MVTTRELWGRRLHRTLTGEDTNPVLVLIEGAAGTGKTRLVRRLTESPAAVRVPCRWWTGGRQTQPEPLEVPEQGQGQEGPMLLVAEDVQHAAPADLERLRTVLEQPSPGLAVVVTYRPEELADAGLPLGAPPPRYAPELTVRRHRLAVWDSERVLRVAHKRLGEACTREVAARLHRLSGGLPYVVTDLVEELGDLDRSRYTAADVDACGVPVRLAQLTLARTTALPRHHRPVVWAAAALDEPATEPELLAVAGLGPREGYEALRQALACGVLTAHGDNRYGHAAPLAAQALREATNGPLREQLHGRAAEVLVRRQPVPWTAVARHRRAAGRVRGWLRALDKAAQQAQEDAETGGHQEVVGLLEQALASPVVPPQARARLAPVLARIAVLRLRSDQTVEVVRRVVEDRTLPAATRGEIRLDLGLLLINQLGDQSSWTELKQAAAELREDRPDLSARALCALAIPDQSDNPLRTHLRFMAEAVRAAEDSGDEVALASVAATQVSVAFSYGDPEGWDMLKALPVDSPVAEVRRHAGRGLCNVANAGLWLGYPRQLEALLVEGIDISARSGAAYTQHTGLGAQLTLDWFLGRWAGLAERCEEFVAATAHMPTVSSDARMVLGLLALAQGEWGQVVSWLTSDEALPVPMAAAAGGALIRRALAREDVAGAAAEARTAWAKVARKGVWVWAAQLAPWAVEATVLAGEPERARAMVSDFSDGVEGLDAPSAVAALTWTRAVLAEVEGRPQDAVPLYAAAAAAYADVPHPYAQALVTEGAGRCRDGTDDDPDRAVSELTASEKQFTELGATWDAARARALLRTRLPAPERRPRGRPAYGDRLSPREREVAELAGTGLTNREIATTLHLSHRTIEQHVAQAMRKLHSPSRQNLAEAVRRAED